MKTFIVVTLLSGCQFGLIAAQPNESIDNAEAETDNEPSTAPEPDESEEEAAFEIRWSHTMVRYGFRWQTS